MFFARSSHDPLQRPDIESNASISVRICPRTVALALSAIIIALVVIATINQVARWQYGLDAESGLVRLFDLEAEKNVPALFAGLQILIAAVTVWLVQRGEAIAWRRRDWRILGAGMAFMAFDEVFRVHERFSAPVEAMLGGGNLGVFTYGWVVPAIGLVVVLAFYFVRFLGSLPGATRALIMAAGALYVGGAVGMEMISGWYWSEYGNSLVQSLLVILEELMEFFGMALFIFAVLRYLQQMHDRIDLRFSN